MKVYVGQTRSARLIDELTELGFGECTQRGELPPRRRPWFADNGAFRDWKASKDFNRAAWWRDVLRYDEFGPDFAVVPDIVAGGLNSLAWSLQTVIPMSQATRAPLFLVVQDGMTLRDTLPHLHFFSGLFVGGTLQWKLEHGAQWVKFAHEHRKLCHIGRVGTAKRVRWALRIRADSIDSCLPLFSRENLARFVHALDLSQTEFDFGTM